MATRKVIEIDEERCDGCGLCIPSCPEGALAIVDDKARLVRDSLCDGIGNCIGECPQGAIRVIEREAEPFVDPLAGKPREEPLARAASALRQWPVELTLVSPMAPWLRGADLLVTADCVPFAYATYHRDFLQGRAVVVGCPKLDDIQAHAMKLKAIFETARPRSVTVLQMEVPCCGGITRATEAAMGAAGLDAPLRAITITIDGAIRQGGTGPVPCGSGPFAI